MASNKIQTVVNELNKFLADTSDNAREDFQPITLVEYTTFSPDEFYDILLMLMKFVDPYTDLAQLDRTIAAQEITASLSYISYEPSESITQYLQNEEISIEQGLVSGKAELYTEIYLYLLENLAEYKERFYFNHFTSPLEISDPRLQMDQDIIEALRKDEMYTEKFIATFKAHQQLYKSTSSNSIEKLKREIIAIEIEKSQIQSRLDEFEIAHNGMNMSPDEKVLMDTCRRFAEKQVRYDKLVRQTEQQQEESQKMQQEVAHCGAEVEEMNKLVNSLESKVSNIDADGASELTGRELRIFMSEKRRYLNQTLPQEMHHLKLVLEELENIKNGNVTQFTPDTNQDEYSIEQQLDRLGYEIDYTEAQVEKLSGELKIKMDTSRDDELLNINTKVAQLRDTTLRQIHSLTNQMSRIDQEISIRMSELNLDELRLYPGGFDDSKDVNVMVEKFESLLKQYEIYNAEDQEYIKKIHIQSEALETLKQKWDKIMGDINAIEQQLGIAGFFQMISGKLTSGEPTDGLLVDEDFNSENLWSRWDLRSLNDKIKQLEESLKNKKSSLKPAVDELKDLKTKVREAQIKLANLNEKYDSIVGPIKSEAEKLEKIQRALEQEVDGISQRFLSLNSILNTLEPLKRENRLREALVEAKETQVASIKTQLAMWSSVKNWLEGLDNSR